MNMLDNTKPPTRTLASDEKVAAFMFYTANSICWGDVFLKSQIRASIWLRTQAAPENICVNNARFLITTTPQNPPKPVVIPEIHLPTHHILAYHLLPPAKDPLDYDPTEPNRAMVPVTIIVGSFRMDGNMRLSTRTSLATYIEVTRESFTPLYDVEIHNLVVPALGVVRVPYAQVRKQDILFATR
jgi:hypothetical protein